MLRIECCLLIIGIISQGIDGNPSLGRTYSGHDSRVAEDRYFHGEENKNEKQITEDDLPKNGELFEGDMIMDDDIRQTVLGIDEKRSADILADVGRRKHWQNGVVPYELDRKILPIIRRQIRRAIRILNHYTCVRYVLRKKSDPDYVYFTSNAKGCSSSVGRVGGRQSIHLARGCSRIGTVLHEMMHAIGIIHEQSRPDRDRHLKVLFENINPVHASNFQKYRWHNTDQLGSNYNFYSVMHYSNAAFSRNGKPTLISLLDKNLKFGQRKQLSSSDVYQINRLYHCDNVKYDETELLGDMTDDIVEETKEDRQSNAKEIDEEQDEKAKRFLDKFLRK